MSEAFASKCVVVTGAGPVEGARVMPVNMNPFQTLNSNRS
ncbi:hypothetical protein FHS52_002912 [Erythromicrobium ramosum]|uniref:Uncharacterized protein n=1 Tax=Erythrobacter ramosus TaxID=35811 RepID=A0ABR6I209_9SPHN|nr:hypothetical protein [Erythrobacter ramosus]